MDYNPWLAWLDAQQIPMMADILRWSNINSHSYHGTGLTTMANTLLRDFTALDARTTQIPYQSNIQFNQSGQRKRYNGGSAITFTKRKNALLQILLVGHMDTVYPKTHPFQHAKHAGDRIHGPGVCDMKGGLAVMLYALQAFERSPIADKLGWQVLLTPDEEIGSPQSADLLETLAQSHDFGLVFEPAPASTNNIVGDRKGSAKFTLVVHGVAAHAGRDFHKGRNAIVAVAQAILALNKLNGQRDGITLNVGKIAGGSAVNVVPDSAVCYIDIRYEHATDQPWLQFHVEQIITELKQLDGISVQLHGGFSRQPKHCDAKTQQLMQHCINTGAMLGQTIAVVNSGGCCDGNNLVAAGLPVIDTMGVRGDHIHSENEFVLVDSLVARAKLTTLLLMRFASGEIHLRS